jgi:hypothetical protein
MRPGARTAQIFSALVGSGAGLYVFFELRIEVSGYIVKIAVHLNRTQSTPDRVTSSLKCCRLLLPHCCFTDTSRYNRFHLYQLRWFGFSADGIQRFGLVEVSITCLLVRFTVNYSSHCQIGSYRFQANKNELYGARRPGRERRQSPRHKP